MKKSKPLSHLILVASFAFAIPCKAGEVLLRFKAGRALNGPLKQVTDGFEQQIRLRDKGPPIRLEIEGRGPAASSSSSKQASVEINLHHLSEFSERLPAAGFFSLPFLFNFDAIVYAAAKPGSEIRKLLDAEIEKAGVHVLWWQPYGSTVIFSKEAPLTNPRQLANRKIFVGDASSAEFIRMCGGVPISKTPPEQTASTPKEAADSVMSSIYAIQDGGNLEGLNIINNIGYSANLVIAVISRESWRSLTPDQRKIVTEAARAAEEIGWEHSAQSEAEAYDLALQKGMTIEPITADDIVAWRSCSSSMVEAFLNRTEFVGARLLAAYGKLRSDPCCNQPLQTETND